MPVANRYILPGSACHLTHRCHDRKFLLLRFKAHRQEYRRRLREVLGGSGVSLLSWCLTSDHVHLLVSAEEPAAIAGFMQRLQGEFAKWYNLRRRRSGAFWNGRYHCTMVESGEHLWRCLRYIDLNMVRAGVVGHPREWPWCGYDELVGERRKFLVLDRDKLLALTEAGSAAELASNHLAMIAKALEARRLQREAQWTDSIAVGSQEFVNGVAERNEWRAKLEIRPGEGDAWLVREAGEPYGLVPVGAEEA
jgi:putative transposase